jgi:hypothetical protein
MQRLIIIPLDSKPGRFSTRLESTGEVIVGNTKQPLVDGARELLAIGFKSSTPLTMRHDGSLHDSFKPLPIGEWAKWTYKEGEKDALKRARWMPLPDDRVGQKLTSELSGVPEATPQQKRLYEATFRVAA